MCKLKIKYEKKKIYKFIFLILGLRGSSERSIAFRLGFFMHPFTCFGIISTLFDWHKWTRIVHSCKKALKSEHLKNYIFQDINYFVKMSVSTLVSTLPNVVYALSQKLVWISERNFTFRLRILRLRAD